MKRNVFEMGIVGLLLLMFSFSAVNAADEVDIIDLLNIAIIWNGGTSNSDVPLGWDVGNDKGEAPEIGKAQLKLFLASLDENITFGKTLDTSDIPDVLLDNKGIDGKLKNVRIYTQGSVPTYDELVSTFTTPPSEIVYINAGASWNSVPPSHDDFDSSMIKLLQEAAVEEVGIMLIGDASATDAKAIDPSKEIFPVMGVQNPYHFKVASKSDTIKGFNFMGDNDDATWKREDVVVGEGGGALGTLKLLDGTKIWDSNGFKHADFISSVDIVYSGWGEWSIKAEAVEVIDIDLYAPQMSSGVFENYDVWLGAKNNTVYVSDSGWVLPIIANDSIIADQGEALPGIKSCGSMSGSNFVLDKDYVVRVAVEAGSADSNDLVIVKSGTSISPISGYDGGKYNGYVAGGFRDLKIKLKNTGKDIFSDIFPSLSGEDELEFKDWKEGGRISAAADIWKFNEKLPPGDFDDIESDGFDRDLYYQTYLGSQVAGRKVSGKPKQFVRPPKDLAEFDTPVSGMMIDSLGYDVNEKVYEVLSAVQKKHRRLLMLGFQPSYLLDIDKAKGLLRDAAIWIGVDDYKLPTPKVTPDDKIYAKDTEFTAIVDFRDKGDGLASSDYTIEYTVTYNGSSSSDEFKIEKEDKVSSGRRDTLTFTLKDLGITIDPTNSSAAEIEFTVTAVAGSTDPFESSEETKRTLDIFKLETPRFNHDTGDYRGSEVEDVLTTDKTTEATGADGIDGVTINYKFSDGDDETAPSPFTYTVNQKTVKLKAHASKDDYINSDPVERTYVKLLSAVEEGSFYFDANADGFIDGVQVEFSSELAEGSLPTTVTLGNPFVKDDADNAKVVFEDQSKMELIDAVTLKIDFSSNQINSDSEPQTSFERAVAPVSFSGGDYDGLTVNVGDSLAPVIVAAEYRFNESPTRDDKSPKDKLYVKFSEDITKPTDGKRLQLKTSAGDTLSIYTAGAEYEPSGFDEYYLFTVDTLFGGAPLPGDSLRISADKITGGDGNVQDNANNRLVPLTVEARPINLKHTVMWIGSNKYPNKTNSDVGDNDCGIGNDKRFNRIEKGVFVVLDPTNRIDASEVENAKCKIAILDALGNVIVSSGGYFDTEEHIVVAPMCWKNPGETSSRPSVGVAWDAKNSFNRPVGESSYYMSVKIDWGEGRQDEISFMISVESGK